MRLTRLARRRTRQRPTTRGAMMLEFALALPFFLAMLFLVIDLSRLMLLSNATTDAAFNSARQSAQIGSATAMDGTGNTVAETAAQEALTVIPGIDPDDIDVEVLQGQCSRYDNNQQFIEVEVTYTTRLIFPGLNQLLGAAGQGETGDGAGSFSIPGRGLARCEVSRQ